MQVRGRKRERWGEGGERERRERGMERGRGKRESEYQCIPNTSMHMFITCDCVHVHVGVVCVYASVHVNVVVVMYTFHVNDARSCCVMRVAFAKHGASWGQATCITLVCVGVCRSDGATDYIPRLDS